MCCYLEWEQLPPITRAAAAVFMAAFEQEYKSSHPNRLFLFVLSWDVAVSAAKVSWSITLWCGDDLCCRMLLHESSPRSSWEGQGQCQCCCSLWTHEPNALWYVQVVWGFKPGPYWPQTAKTSIYLGHLAVVLLHISIKSEQIDAVGRRSGCAVPSALPARHPFRLPWASINVCGAEWSVRSKSGSDQHW